MDERKVNRFLAASLTMLFLAIVLVSVQRQIKLPYFIISPGGATSVNDQIEVPPDKAYPPKGDVLFTTVSVIHARPFDMVWAWLTPHTEIEKQKDVIGDATPEQYYEANERSMDESQMIATYIAMKRAGFDVKLTGEGATVQAVAENTPASGHLRPDDTITAVNAQPVSLAADLGDVIRPLPTGTPVHLDVVDSAGVKRSLDVSTAARPSDGSSFIGVSVKTKNPRVDGPFKINLNIENVGGPSAGLAFTLSALDELTPGELTGGREVATTGTIDLDGSVGEVGGVEQKTRAVVDSGAKLFLVPFSEAAEAQKFASKGVKVVGVRNLDDALTALRDNGGDTSGIPSTTSLQPAA